jgi:hypothetical protein
VVGPRDGSVDGDALRTIVVRKDDVTESRTSTSKIVAVALVSH